MFKNNKKVVSALVLVLAILPMFLFVYEASAQQVNIPQVNPPIQSGPLTGPEDLISLLRQVLRWFTIVFWIFAVMAIFYAGYEYLTSTTNPENVGKANKALLYAAIAIVVGLVAYGIPAFIDTFLRSRG